MKPEPRFDLRRSGPISISTFLLSGSMRAVFGPAGYPNSIILSITQFEENCALPGTFDATFKDVSLPSEKTKRRWM